ncbi:TTL-domain-containing protein [Aureobasidium subglaciale]|nr:TTL-domain-containing protein [Aureobasidium subglaciale]
MAEHNPSTGKVHAIIEYEDRYVQPLILAALKARMPAGDLVLVDSISEAPVSDVKVLQWKQYEALDLDHVMGNSQTSLMNSYIIRKALIRKHYLSTTVSHWLTKNPESCLRKNVKPSVEFELDFAEFLDDALLEAFELRESFEQNEGLEASQKQWWILKPGMSDRGQGIRLFNSEEDLTAIFESWEEESDDEDAEHSGDEEQVDDEEDEGNGVMTSQLRHFIAQPYIHPPLLFSAPFASAERKFHIRTYILAVGALKVFVYKPMLALFAGNTYTAPWESEDPNEDLASHLTNTCMQTGEREGSVHAFWSLPDDVPGLPSGWKQSTFDQICNITADVFEGAARGMMVHFQPLPNAFELFGVDFMLDAEGNPYLLEINAFPDFAQTGDELNSIVQGLFEEVIDVAIKPFFGLSTKDGQESRRDRMAMALDIDLGRN